MVDPADLQAQLQVLRDSYAVHLPGKLKQIEQAWTELPRGVWDEAGLQTLHRMVHSLTGAGKTFGFAVLSDVARSLEDCLQQLVQAKTVPGEEQRERIQILLRELHQAAQHRNA